MTVEITTLHNGLRVATDTMDTVETVTLGAWTGIGARNETADINGMAHFLEHMVFKGTPSKTSLQIAQMIENVGGYMNAYTSYENTAYFNRLLADDAQIGVELISDIVQRAHFDPEELEVERGVIEQEIGMYQDEPSDVVYEIYRSIIFPDQPLGRSILGPVSNIKKFQQGDFKSFLSNHYNAQTMVVTAAGKIDHDHFVTMAESHFNDLPNIQTPHDEKALYKGGFEYKEKDSNQAHVMMGFESSNHYDDTYFTARVTSALFGGGMSSRLFQEVREKRGLVYSVYSYAESYKDTGLFTVYAGTDPDRLDELVPVIIDEFKKLADAIEDEELKRAKNQLKASILMRMESTQSRCDALGKAVLLHGQKKTTAQMIKEIEAVTKEKVLSYVHDILKSRLSIAAYGPMKKMPDYDLMVQRLQA